MTSDMIIAIVPAEGHEHLVADGPAVDGCVPERPMTVRQCGCGRWGHRGCAELLSHAVNPPVALVLHAPGGPKLGMLRAMEAVFGNDAEAAVVRWDGEHEGWLADRDGDTLCDWPVASPPTGTPALALPAFALAHLLVQRGIAAEVVVLPADKAKE